MMQTDKATPELFASLAAAQAEIENAAKNAANPHFRSKYADLAEVLNTVRPVFAKHGLSLVQSTGFDGQHVSVTTLVGHKGGGYITSVASCVPAKTDAQGVGSATTYLRRYSLAAMAGVAQEDDDGNAAAHDGKPQRAKLVRDEPPHNAAKLETAKREHASTIQTIKDALAVNNLSKAAEAWFELSDEDKQALWVAPTKGGPFTTAERDMMKTREFREAYYGPEQKAAKG